MSSFDMNFGMVQKGRKRLVEMKHHPMVRMVGEYPKRFKAMGSEMTRRLSVDYGEVIKDAAPSGADGEEIRKNVVTSELIGMPRNSVGHVVHLKQTERAARKSDANTKLVWVQAKKLAPGGERIRVLVDHSPWTTDTIPFFPGTREAHVAFRSASERQVSKVRKQKKRTERVWRAQLNKAGARMHRRKRLSKSSEKLMGVPATAADLLARDLGVSADPSAKSGVLRKGLLSLVKKKVPTMANKRGSTPLSKVVTDPHNKEWLGWPQRSKGERMNVKEMERFKEFHDRLGLSLKL